MQRRTMAGLLGGAVLVGSTLFGAVAPASAACVTQVGMYGGYNACATPLAHHYNKISDGTTKWAPLVTPGHWSNQPQCWPNMTSYGMVGYGY